MLKFGNFTYLEDTWIYIICFSSLIFILLLFFELIVTMLQVAIRQINAIIEGFQDKLDFSKTCGKGSTCGFYVVVSCGAL